MKFSAGPLSVLVASALVGVLAQFSRAAHSAYAVWAQDSFGPTNFAGTSNPAGTYQVNVSGAAPGYLNGILNQSDGNVSLAPPTITGPELLSVAIHLADTAGGSHSLSDLNDPALGDIIFDVNHSGIGGDFILTAYPFNSPPTQYAAGAATLSAGESANGGQPFDILLVAGPSSFHPLNSWLSLGFSTEIGNLDGITALRVTDIGAVPEPATLLMLVAFAAPMLLARRRRA